jgi:hypothetical protein
MVPLVYSPAYNVTAFGLERLHPFDSRKYRRIRDWLVRQGLRRPRDFVAPRPCTHADLLRVHTPEYLRSLRDRRVLARILEVPVVRHLPAWLIAWRVLRPMRRATGGTVRACRLALEKGLAINLGGGYHHAGPDRGGGSNSPSARAGSSAAVARWRRNSITGAGWLPTRCRPPDVVGSAGGRMHARGQAVSLFSRRESVEAPGRVAVALGHRLLHADRKTPDAGQTLGAAARPSATTSLRPARSAATR